MKIPLALILNA